MGKGIKQQNKDILGQSIRSTNIMQKVEVKTKVNIVRGSGQMQIRNIKLTRFDHGCKFFYFFVDQQHLN